MTCEHLVGRLPCQNPAPLPHTHYALSQWVADGRHDDDADDPR